MLHLTQANPRPEIICKNILIQLQQEWWELNSFHLNITKIMCDDLYKNQQ